MNGRSQMQGGKNWILPKEINATGSVLLRLSLAGNLEKPLTSLYGTEWRDRSYGLSLKLLFTPYQTNGTSSLSFSSEEN
jgi:hypothetical protein